MNNYTCPIVYSVAYMYMYVIIYSIQIVNGNECNGVQISHEVKDQHSQLLVHKILLECKILAISTEKAAQACCKITATVEWYMYDCTVPQAPKSMGRSKTRYERMSRIPKRNNSNIHHLNGETTAGWLWLQYCERGKLA